MIRTSVAPQVAVGGLPEEVVRDRPLDNLSCARQDVGSDVGIAGCDTRKCRLAGAVQEAGIVRLDTRLAGVRDNGAAGLAGGRPRAAPNDAALAGRGVDVARVRSNVDKAASASVVPAAANSGRLAARVKVEGAALVRRRDALLSPAAAIVLLASKLVGEGVAGFLWEFEKL